MQCNDVFFISSLNFDETFANWMYFIVLWLNKAQISTDGNILIKSKKTENKSANGLLSALNVNDLRQRLTSPFWPRNYGSQVQMD